MMKVMWGLVFLCLFHVVTINAFIYDVVVLKRTLQGRDQYVIGCSDFHDKSNPITGEQLALVESMLRTSDPHSIKVILEDLSSGNELCNGMCDAYKVNSRGGFLGGLTDKCRALGLTVDNVEYRYCRVSALSPVLNNLAQSPYQFAPTEHLTLQRLVTEIDQVIREIRLYDDGPLLKTYYQRVLRSMVPNLTTFKKAPYYQKSIADYLTVHSEERKRLDTIKHLLTFDCDLFDARLVHAVAKSSDYDKVLIFAGGAHVSRSAAILKGVGFQVMYEAPVEFRKEFDLHRCIGSEIIDGAFCLCPQPVDISMVGHVIQNQ